MRHILSKHRRGGNPYGRRIKKIQLPSIFNLVPVMDTRNNWGMPFSQ